MMQFKNINLKVKIFADGANLEEITALAENPLIKGFTTNPTLMRRAGITDYEGFAHQVLKVVRTRPVCFEVFADDLESMYRQAKKISSWGSNVIVKIPVTNTLGEFTGPIIKSLSEEGTQLNITAIMTQQQIEAVSLSLSKETYSILSIFAGRIADTGRDPLPHVQNALNTLKSCPKAELLWASPRETLNIFQADRAGCHIITVTPNFLKKLEMFNKSLSVYSLETVKMFHHDAMSARYEIQLD